MKQLIVSLTVLVGLMTASASFSGSTNELPLPGNLSNNFPELARLRAKLVERAIPQAEKELALLRSKQDTVDTREKVYAREIEIAKRQVEILQRQDPPHTAEITALEKKLEQLTARLDDAKKTDFTEAIKQKEAEVFEKKLMLASVEDNIQDLLNPDVAKQKFKSSVSMVFAALVGAVILGFFAVAFHDERVRQAIFSGQAGMQFVTLFSLVIAIILFGITSILEAKELAALLGGLSGYILGRVTAERQAVPAPGTAPQPASAAPPATAPVPVQP
jgi:predicted phage tail protein